MFWCLDCYLANTTSNYGTPSSEVPRRDDGSFPVLRVLCVYTNSENCRCFMSPTSLQWLSQMLLLSTGCFAFSVGNVGACTTVVLSTTEAEAVPVSVVVVEEQGSC